MMVRRASVIVALSLLTGAIAGAVLEHAYSMPFYARDKGMDIDGNWCDYVSTESLILRHGADKVSHECILSNNRSFRNLVKSGELVTILYPCKDPSIAQKIYDFMSSHEIKDYRCGTGVDGGQWPMGELTVEHRYVDIMNKLIEDSSLPDTNVRIQGHS